MTLASATTAVERRRAGCGLELTAGERARHAALSPAQAAWLDFVAAHPQALDRAAFAALDAAVELEPDSVQPWPLFLDPRGVALIVEAATTTLELIKTVPERIFGCDAARMSEFYGVDQGVARGAAALLAAPGFLEQIIGRGDFLRGPLGFACCEFNVAGNLGGWQVALWKERMLPQPLVAEFLARHGWRALRRNPLDALLDHAIALGIERGLAVAGELNLAVLTDNQVPRTLLAEVERRYRESLESRGVSGSLFVCTERQLTWDGVRARFGARPVQLFLDQMNELFDGPVFRAQTSGSGFGFNGMASPILSDKRNLALLSEQAASGEVYEPEERAAIERFIPWTRVLVDGFAERGGERFYLPDLVRAERQRLVIKPATGFGGTDVLLGAAVEQAAWDARVDAALADGCWVVQEFVPSGTYLFQAREGGAAPHELIWGPYIYGGRFGSCLLRSAPTGAGVVNVNRGARLTVLVEVEDCEPVSSPEPSCHEETCDAP
jgi:hypothetical protein